MAHFKKNAECSLYYNNVERIQTTDDGAKIIKDPVNNDSETNINKTKFLSKEKTRLKKFKFQYFIHRIGAAPFKGYGDSIKKGASDAGNDGMAYRIYGCGMLGNVNKPQILIPLETLVVLSH